MTPGVVGAVLADATAEEAQLVLSFIVWPGEAPDPRLVDAWVRREQGTGGCLNATRVAPPERPRPLPRRMPREAAAA